jgi:hypothetical protein
VFKDFKNSQWRAEGGTQIGKETKQSQLASTHTHNRSKHVELAKSKEEPVPGGQTTTPISKDTQDLVARLNLKRGIKSSEKYAFANTSN